MQRSARPTRAVSSIPTTLAVVGSRQQQGREPTTIHTAVRRAGVALRTRQDTNDYGVHAL
ncbi:MAG: hypothetical protein ACR2JG_04895 [Geodermatophilaceae bacterium]